MEFPLSVLIGSIIGLVFLSAFFSVGAGSNWQLFVVHSLKKLSNSKDSKNLEVIKRIKGGITQKNIEQDFWLEQEEFDLLASIFKVCIHIWDSRGNFWTYIPINYKDNFDTCINKQQNIYIYADGIHYQTLKRKI